jgi:hypothetical protein
VLQVRSGLASLWSLAPGGVKQKRADFTTRHRNRTLLPRSMIESVDFWG